LRTFEDLEDVEDLKVLTRSSKVLKGPQRSSKVLKVLKGPQRSSKVLKGPQRYLLYL